MGPLQRQQTESRECTCRIPELGDHNSYMAAIEALPLVQTPEVFGLHANADISYYTSATKALWRNLVGFLWTPQHGMDHPSGCKGCSP